MVLDATPPTPDVASVSERVDELKARIDRPDPATVLDSICSLLGTTPAELRASLVWLTEERRKSKR